MVQKLRRPLEMRDIHELEELRDFLLEELLMLYLEVQELKMIGDRIL